jgi:GGDEF domain-containing protein
MGDAPDPHMAAGPSGDGPPSGQRPQTRLARAARAAEELCAPLWEALHEELRHGDGQRAGELAERLTQVCAAVAALAGEAPRAAPPAPPEGPEIAIHDIRREGSQTAPAPRGSDPAAWAVPGARELGEPAPAGGGDPVAAAAERPAGWAASIARGIERYAIDGLPFAVLLVEVLGVGRLAQAEPEPALAALLDRVEHAIGLELRPSDHVVRETHGRWWLTASRTDVAGARPLGERLARTVRSAAVHRGVPLELAIGIAVCPVDGRDVATLTAHADVSLYAARAVGMPVAPSDDAA